MRNTTVVWQRFRASRGGFHCLLSLVVLPALLVAGCVPMYDSNPNASFDLYLDFDGHQETGWPIANNTFDVNVPPFELNDGPNAPGSTFSPGELAAIQEIWQRVAEDYAPFNVNVTTQEPPGLTTPPIQGIRVVIGGDQQAIGRSVRGYDVRGTSDADFNVGLVPLIYQGQPRTAQSIAHTASHEAAHLFGWWNTEYPLGLSHYQAQHNILNQGKTQIMGTHADVRDIWWKDSQVTLGVDLSGNLIVGAQEDISVLLAVLGPRGVDHLPDPELGTPLVEVSQGGNTWLEGSGYITMNAESWPRTCAPWGDPGSVCPAIRDENAEIPMEKDFFIFQAGLGQFTARVDTINDPMNAADTRANLDAEIELWRRQETANWVQLQASGNLHGANDLWAGLSHTVSAGQTGLFAVAVKSQGGYGDLGQYTVTVVGNNVSEP